MTERDGRAEASAIAADYQLAAWMTANKVRTDEDVVDCLLQVGDDLGAGKITVADAQRELTYVRAAALRLKG
jgi:hypothetical protein